MVTLLAKVCSLICRLMLVDCISWLRFGDSVWGVVSDVYGWFFRVRVLGLLDEVGCAAISANVW